VKTVEIALCPLGLGFLRSVAVMWLHPVGAVAGLCFVLRFEPRQIPVAAQCWPLHRMKHRTRIILQMEQNRNVYMFLTEGMRSLGKPRNRCLDKIRWCGPSIRWARPSNAAYSPEFDNCQHCSEFPGYVKDLKFLEQLSTTSFSVRALPHEVSSPVRGGSGDNIFICSLGLAVPPTLLTDRQENTCNHP
jgi:hypothetical protein